MKLFTSRPEFDEAWNATTFRVVAAGMGDDTIRLIAEMYERGYEPDEIIFCNTGSEFPHTYKMIEYFRKWCEGKKWSKFVVLNKQDKNGEPLNVYDHARNRNTFPAAAFGMKTCSLRFKTETLDKYLNNHPSSWSAWGASKKGSRSSTHNGSLLRIVGLNAHEGGRVAKWQPQDKWVQVYPLFDWGIGDDKNDVVVDAGLYYPGKSSCYCCPNLTGPELRDVKKDYPELFIKLIDMEGAHINANPESPVGLFRRTNIAGKLKENSDQPTENRCSECVT